MQSEKVREKAYATKRKNHTFNTSCVEIELTKWFKDNNIDILTQYKCDKYPYMCDFYLPKYDLFIEIYKDAGHMVVIHLIKIIKMILKYYISGYQKIQNIMIMQ